MQAGDDWVKRSSRQSLRLLGTVGEPINPEVWTWYHEVVGEGRCGIVDTWWQTETGGILITPLAGITPTKPGSATLPFLGIEPSWSTTTAAGSTATRSAATSASRSRGPGRRGRSGATTPLPRDLLRALPRALLHRRRLPRDADGYYWITGRVDDVLNVSGHRLGTAEIESALVAHEAVAEAAVVGFPHDIKGTGICAYVIGARRPARRTRPPSWLGALKEQVRQAIGAIATPDRIVVATGLPKTRSGKIMRRILRKIAAGQTTTWAI
jgi:acetyl-CoA synthetase